MPTTIPMAHPANLAGAYLEGVQTAGNIRAAQMRLEQQAQENASRLKEEEKRVQEQHAIEQQRIQVAASYNAQKAALRKQQLDQVAAVNAQRTADAARQFGARQAWDKGLSAIDARADLTEEQKDTERRKLIMRLGPQMGTAGTEVAGILHAMPPAKANIPATVKDMGPYIQVTQPNGTTQIHVKPREPKAGDPNVKVVLQPDMPPTTMPRSQAMQVIPGLPPQLQTNAVNKAVMAGTPQAMPSKFKEGDLIRDKGTGTVYRIENGRPVEYKPDADQQ